MAEVAEHESRLNGVMPRRRQSSAATTSQINNDIVTGFERKQFFKGVFVALSDAHQQLGVRSFICLMFPNPSMRLISVANKTIEAKLTNSNRQV